MSSFHKEFTDWQSKQNWEWIWKNRKKASKNFKTWRKKNVPLFLRDSMNQNRQSSTPPPSHISTSFTLCVSFGISLRLDLFILSITVLLLPPFPASSPFLHDAFHPITSCTARDVDSRVCWAVKYRKVSVCMTPPRLKSSSLLPHLTANKTF